MLGISFDISITSPECISVSDSNTAFNFAQITILLRAAIPLGLLMSLLLLRLSLRRLHTGVLIVRMRLRSVLVADAYSSRPPLSGELQQDSHDGEGRASDNVSSAGLPSFRRAESSDLSGCQVVPTGTQPAQPAAKEVGPPVSKFAADTLRPSDHVADGHPEKPAARPTSSQLISPPASPPPVAKEEGEQQQKQQEEGRTPEQESYDAQVGETQQAGNEAIIEGRNSRPRHVTPCLPPPTRQPPTRQRRRAHPGMVPRQLIRAGVLFDYAISSWHALAN